MYRLKTYTRKIDSRKENANQACMEEMTIPAAIEIPMYRANKMIARNQPCGMNDPC